MISFLALCSLSCNNQSNPPKAPPRTVVLACAGQNLQMYSASGVLGFPLCVQAHNGLGTGDVRSLTFPLCVQVHDAGYDVFAMRIHLTGCSTGPLFGINGDPGYPDTVPPQSGCLQ